MLKAGIGPKHEALMTGGYCCKRYALHRPSNQHPAERLFIKHSTRLMDANTP